MTRMVYLLAVVTLTVLPSMLAAQDVKTESDKSYDFSRIKTFAVKVGTPWGNQPWEAQMVNDVTRALTAGGWQVAPEDTANAVVVIHGAGETKRALNTFYEGWGGWGWGGIGASTTTASEYRVGTLVIDIFESPTKKLLFRGTAQGELSKDQAKNQKKGQKATEKIFKNFPPKRKA